MDRYYSENPTAVIADEETEDERLIAQTGDQHERAVLDELRFSHADLVEVSKDDPVARTTTLLAINKNACIIIMRLWGVGCLLDQRISSYSTQTADIKCGMRNSLARPSRTTPFSFAATRKCSLA